MHLGLSLGLDVVTGGSAAPPGDVTAPTLSSAALATNGLTLTLTYDEALDTGSQPATTAYALTGTSSTVSSLNVTGSTVVLTLNTAAFWDETITLAYTAPGAGNVQDLAGNDAANLSGQAVTNSTVARATDPISIFGGILAEFLIGDLGVTVTGSGVSTWANQASSGVTGDATQATDADRPVFSASDLNSKGTISLDGVSDDLQFASLDVPAPGTTPSWFGFVLRQGATWTSGDRIYSGGGTTTFSIRQAGVSPEISVNNTSAGPVNAGAALSTWTRVRVFLNNATTDYIKAGSAAASTGTNTGNSNPASGTTFLGSSGTIGFWIGKFAVVIRCTAEPSGAVQTRWDSWITAYYGGLVAV